MAAAVKLRTIHGVYCYLDIKSVIYLIDMGAYVRIVTSLGVGVEKHLDTAVDIDDLAQMIWGNGNSLPKRPSKRTLAEGTVIQ